MPSTPKQQRAAGMELRKRRDGTKTQQGKGGATRAFGSMSESNLSKYAQGIDKEIDKLKDRLATTGSKTHKDRLSRAIDQKQRQEKTGGGG